MHQETKDRA